MSEPASASPRGSRHEEVLTGPACSDSARRARSIVRVVADTVERLSTHIDTVCRGLLIAAVLVSCGLIFVSVAGRALTGSSLSWANDATALLMAAAAFYGCVSAFHHSDHVGLQQLSTRLIRGRARREVDAAVSVATGLFATAVGWHAGVLSTEPGVGTFGSEQWSTHLLYVPLAAGMGLVAVVALLRLISDVARARTWIGPSVVAVVTIAGYLWLNPLRQVFAGGEVLIAVGAIIVMMALGTPISFAIGLGTVLGIIFASNLSLAQVPLQMTNLVTNLTLVSLPFFILAGVLLGEGDVAARLLGLVRRLSRNARGGEGVAAVVCMYLLSGLSGSKFADIAAVAPALTGSASDRETDGKVQAEMAGVLNASAVMGETVPPSIMMLVLGSVTTISTGALFAAGLLPAALLGCGVIVTALIRVRRMPTPAGPRDSWLRAIVGAVPALVGITIIVGGIIGGFATPSEASSLATVYSLLLVLIVYRVGWRRAFRAIANAARLAGMLLFLISITGALAWFFTMSGIAADVLDVVKLTGTSTVGFLLLSAILLMILGTVFEGLPAILIFAPMLVPEAVNAGVNDLQFGIVLLMALGVGTFLPPFGVGYYATCAIVRVQPERALRATMAYLLPVALGVLLLALIPQLTTVVGDLFDVH